MSELKGTSKKKTYKKLLGVLILVLIIFAGYYFISSQQGKPKSSFDGFIDKDSIFGLNAKTWTLFSTYSWIKLSQLTPIFFRYLSGDK